MAFFSVFIIMTSSVLVAVIIIVVEIMTVVSPAVPEEVEVVGDSVVG